MEIKRKNCRKREISMAILLSILWVLCPCVQAQSKAVVSQETKAFRAKYKADFLKEKRSPFYGKAKDLEQLSFYAPKRKYRIAGRFERTLDAEVFDMATYSGQTQKYVQYGWIHYDWRGKKEKIAVYQSLRLREVEEYKDHLFIPFRDQTSDRSTYGGGRYIDMATTDIQGEQVTLDFNQCYNPYYAFKGGYSCPIPPRENNLTWAVKAGEKKFKGKH